MRKSRGKGADLCTMEEGRKGVLGVFKCNKEVKGNGVILKSFQWEIKPVVQSYTLKHNQKLNYTQHLTNSKS